MQGHNSTQHRDYHQWRMLSFCQVFFLVKVYQSELNGEKDRRQNQSTVKLIRKWRMADTHSYVIPDTKYSGEMSRLFTCLLLVCMNKIAYLQAVYQAHKNEDFGAPLNPYQHQSPHCNVFKY